MLACFSLIVSTTAEFFERLILCSASDNRTEASQAARSPS
jgi:hypothetical protein